MQKEISNLDERMDKFFEFELSLSDEELKFWDIIRSELFEILVYQKEEPIYNSCLKNQQWIRILYNLILGLINLIKNLFSNKGKRLFFICSRYKIGQQFVDVNVNDIFEQIKNEYFKIETYNTKDYIFTLYNHLHYPSKKIKQAFSDSLVIKVNTIFNENIKSDFYKIRLRDYFNEINYYNFLFSILKPKSIYFIENGIHKGMITAAKNLKIPIIEVQHGEIGMSHPCYWYPQGFKAENVVAADYLFVWADFWKQRINFPGVRIITIGNSYYYPRKYLTTGKKIYDFCIFSNTLHTPIFDDFLSKLLSNGYRGNIGYKLHPQQVNELDSIRKRWKDYPNVHVFLFEKSAIDLICETNAIFVIHSTVVFQALDMNCKVLLYTTISEYLSHEDVLNHPNVYLVKDTNDFIENLNKPIAACDVQYYCDFDKDKFKSLIDTYNL